MPVRLPHPALRPYLGAIVGYRDELDPQAVHHGLPGPWLTVILAFDQPLDAGWLRPPEGRAAYWTCAAGLHPAPALIRTHGFQHGIQLALTPLGARALLGLPAAGLGSAMTTHDDLPLGVGDDLHAALAALPDWESRFDLLERDLLGLLSRAHDDPVHRIRPEVAEAWRLVVASHGTVRVADVAERVGWGRRRLLDGFRAEFGITPKEAARIVRFDRARGLIDGGLALAAAAYACGFADQAHLTREYADLAGRSPALLHAAAYHLADG